ncbi:hypothetical protein JIG36_35125 [Actinoplanes sp. LDG1-06]|uniref:Uncharacterized protein n=1 Tax=Paractinoplanes ovalisporus TaxID=2810368 RepID=A0ABS2ALT2_9ACTN|nr:hypothetical protein [Actinoplanes ovalisporus]MBM2620746.1 hypothetical protein [Actinoplanes ovalisporus]
MRIAVELDGWDGKGEIVVRISTEGNAPTAAIRTEDDAGTDAGAAPADLADGSTDAETAAIDAGPAPDLDDNR